MAAVAPWATSAIRGPPATTTMKMPWSRPRTSSAADDRAGRDAGEEQREGEPALGGAGEALVRDLGEEGARHPEDHRDDVDEERHQQHRMPAQVADALDHRSQAGWSAARSLHLERG